MSDNNNQISLLRWMLEDVRKETLAGVNHLSKDQLFAVPAQGESSIGSYLMHLAECDISWLKALSGKEQPEELKNKCYFDKWFDSGDNSDPPKKALEVSEYYQVIEQARKNFLDHVSMLHDNELEEVITRKGRTREFKLTKKWIIYHILEHEAHHRGQIFMLIRKAGWNKNKNVN